MPVAKNINKVDHYNKEMMEIGYEPKGENGITSRRFYQKGGNQRTHHVHIFEEGDTNIIRHLAFKSYLQNHPDIAIQYGELKETLAIKFTFDPESYLNGKAPFVKEIEQKALDWYREQY